MDTPKNSIFLKYLLYATAVLWVVVQLYGTIFGYIDALLLNVVHVYLASAIIFLTTRKYGLAPTLALVGLSYMGSIYYTLSFERITTRMPFVSPITNLDIFFGLLTIAITLLAVFALFGWPITILVSFFTIYPFLEAGFTFDKLKEYIDLQFLGTEGVFGIPIYVSTFYVFMFMLFAALLEATGAGEDIKNFALSIVGSKRGGPAKVAVIASSLFGMLSGSATANVVATGTFTIPLMKKTGFEPKTAGAIEAVASTGGQLMPPIMGAAAFIMAQLLGIHYWDVVIAAWIPAFLYYLTVYLMIDFYSIRMKLFGMPRDLLPSLKKSLVRSYSFIIPIALLILLLSRGYSPTMAAFSACVATILIGLVRGNVRRKLVKPAEIIKICEKTANSASYVASVCAGAGIIIGSITLTGLGLRLTSMLIDLSRGNIFLLLILTALAAIILGMGMPTSGAYVTAAVLLAPALVFLGITRIAAHMFIFYYACLSAITPPVALAAYAASGLAQESPMKIGFMACKIGVTAFLLPFLFVFYPQLLMIGEPLDIALRTFFVFLGIIPLSAGVMGHLSKELSMPLRLVCIGLALLILYPETVSSIIGLAFFIALVLILKRWKPRGKTAGAGEGLSRNVG